MAPHTVRHVVRGLVFFGVALQLATLGVAAAVWSGHAGAVTPGAAAAVMVGTLALQAAVIVVQLLPGGRAMVPVFTPSGDGWLFAIVSTMLPGVLWSTLGAVAGPPLSLIASGFAGPALLGVLMMVGRLIQLRRMAPPRATAAQL